MPVLEEVRMMLAYVWARLGRDRSEAGITTMEILTWSLAVLVIGGAIAALVYNGFLEDAKEIRRSPRPVAP